MDRKGRQPWLLRLAWPLSMSTGASADGSIWGTGRKPEAVLEVGGWPRSHWDRLIRG